jgi:hypothetical protein
LVIFLSLLYLLSNVKDKSHVTFGGGGTEYEFLSLSQVFQNVGN